MKVPLLRKATDQITLVHQTLSELWDGDRKPLSQPQLNTAAALIEACQSLLANLQINDARCEGDSTDHDFCKFLQEINDFARHGD